jgi:hypothetical protein
MASNEGITRSSLLIQKQVTNAPVVNLYKQWNIVCTKIPIPKLESKELPTHDFSGENGEDTYIPSFIPVKAYDCTIEFAYKGSLDSCYDNIYLGFIKYLQGTAPSSDDYDSITEGGFKIYDYFNKIGRQNVYMKSFDPNELIHLDDGDHITFKLDFRFTDPATDITLTDPNAKVTL